MDADWLDSVLRKALVTWGRDSQFRMAQEECGELIAEIGRALRGRSTAAKLVDEVADVLIMCRQLTIVLGHDEVEAAVHRKLDRLIERIASVAPTGEL